MNEIIAPMAAFLGLGAGLFFYILGFTDWYDRRLLDCTPVSKCRSAALGPVVIKGTVVGLNPIPSLIAHLPSFISRVVVEVCEQRGRSSSWRTVHKREFRMPFYIRDDSGELKVIPEDAVLWLQEDVKYSSEDGTVEYSPAAGDRAVQQTETLDEMFHEYCVTRGINMRAPRRFRETNLSPGDPVFIHGAASSGRDSGEQDSTVVRNTFWQRLYIVEGDKTDMVSKLKTRGFFRILGGSMAVIAAAGVLAAATSATAATVGSDYLISETSIEAEILTLIALFSIGVFIYGTVVYNGLINLRNEVERAFSNIDVLLQQRFDLIPNLVSVCKAYMDHESSVMLAVSASRSQWAAARDRTDKLAAAAVAVPPLRKLLATAEAYPRLRANENFLQLQSELSSLEAQIADRRELYNSAVSLFNSRIQIFPDRILANAFQFTAQPFYSAEGTPTHAPVVKVTSGD